MTQTAQHPDSDVVALDGAEPGPDAGGSAEDAPDAPAPTPIPLLLPPTQISAMLKCPICGDVVTVVAKLFTRLTRDSDGTSALALRTKAPKAAHSCDQESLGLAEGDRVR